MEALGGHEPGRTDARGPTAILPGLVNAHTHLELSHLKGRVPPSASFVDWVRQLLALRRGDDARGPEIEAAAREAIAHMRATGTALAGDVSNTLMTVPWLREAGLAAQVFHELLGFNADDPEGIVASARSRVDATIADAADVRGSLAPHAPYSVSVGLFDAIRADLLARRDAVSTIHLGESPAEVELLREGTGPLRRLLDDLGVWTGAWQVPAVSPVEYLSRLQLLDPRVLVVHGTQLNAQDLSTLATRGVTLVTCPRSNRHVGVGDPPVQAFYDAGVPVAIGTDSLASAPDLNLFAELAAARRLAPRVPARQLLESATAIGARALGLGADFGTIAPGRRAALLEVSLPGDLDDVEEYLVGGAVRPDQIRWIGESVSDARAAL